MKALLFAETRGSRMGRLTTNTPKPMLLVAGKPILQHSIEAIRDGGIKEIIIFIHFYKEKIKDFFSNGKKYGVNITYFEPEKIRGMAFSLYGAHELIPDDHFLVVQGDIVFSQQLISELSKFQVKHRHTVSIAVSKEFELAYSHRLVSIGKRNRIESIRKRIVGKKNEYRCIGAWGFSANIFHYLASIDFSDKNDWTIMTVLKKLLNKKVKQYCFTYKGFWRSFHYPSDLLYNF